MVGATETSIETLGGVVDHAPPDRAWWEVVARGGVEPPTYRFSGGRSYQLSYLAKRARRSEH
jgi:hypothetical protein